MKIRKFYLFLSCLSIFFSFSSHAENIFDDVNDYSITSCKWKVSILVKPELEQVSDRAVFGHSILSFIGKNDNDRANDYVLWAADFGANIEKKYALNGALRVNNGCISTTEDPDGSLFALLENNYYRWSFTSWAIDKENALQSIQRIKNEKIEPPHYNLFGHDTLAFFRSKSTYNCASWALEKVRQCGIHAPGTWFKNITGIVIPGPEATWGYDSDTCLQSVISPTSLTRIVNVYPFIS